ncbi:MAG: response regulator transcription factor [Elusimicrobia bacterium]|nr:response regulator transcription factor [Elusimicrobiota bacterium]
MALRARILVVDDEADNRCVFGDLLKAEGYVVRLASSGDEAFGLAVDSPPDLVLSDVAMSGGDGLSLLARLRAERTTKGVPVILMSGVRTDAEQQADGLESGADDYLPKPVPPMLLRAKVAAVLRRAGAAKELRDILKSENLRLDVAARTVDVSGKRVGLTRKEFDLLTTFLSRPGKVLSIPFLLETVWGYDPSDYSDPHTVGVHVSTLRKKVGAKIGRRIVALPGLGYRYEA